MSTNDIMMECQWTSFQTNLNFDDTRAGTNEIP